MNKTLNYYNENYEQFTSSTVNVDMSHLYNIFFKYLKTNAKILDLGCGTGRDSLFFKSQKYSVIATDGSEKMCEIASNLLKTPVILQKFDEIQYKDEFDGIWAYASLLHLTYKELENIIPKLIRALHYNGCLFISFKYGCFEGFRQDRYFTDMSENKFKAFISKFSNLKISELLVTNDVKKDCENEKWLNAVLLKQ